MAAIPEVEPTDVRNNSQSVNITAANLERISKSRGKFDSMIDDRKKTYQNHKSQPRFNEYR